VLAVKAGVLIPAGTRFLLPPGKVVQPGETHTFTFAIQAPFLDFATTELQMMHEGMSWFGELLSLFVGIIDDDNPAVSLIRLSPPSGPPGTFVTVDLVKSPGFDPGSQIRFSFGDPRGYPYSLLPVSSAWVDDTQMTFTVPEDAGCGSHFAAVEMWGTAASEPAQFEVTGPCDASRRNSFDVLTYNIQMLPDEACLKLDKCHKDYRAPLIAHHPLLQDHDAIVFVEAFSDSHRELIQRILRPQYPYQGLILGGDHLSGVQDGGVIILSKWPIETEAQHVFSICNGFADCHADKGVNYARINKAGQRYHVFGTHFDSGDDYGDISARSWQLLIMDQVIKNRGIPDSEPVLMAGDFNIDRNSSNGEYDRMLRTLNASQPPIQGLRRWTNPKGQWLDYVLYSNAHVRPNTSWNIVLLPRDGNGGDLSDHYAVLGSFVFGISENLAEDSSRESAKIPIADGPLETIKRPVLKPLSE
jgi:endonuclease/exonuclease/phosphatase family metal-dependent hydrolase